MASSELNQQRRGADAREGNVLRLALAAHRLGAKVRLLGVMRMAGAPGSGGMAGWTVTRWASVA
jgi:hypothetical protein